LGDKQSHFCKQEAFSRQQFALATCVSNVEALQTMKILISFVLENAFA
jgi:hypothetical protein